MKSCYKANRASFFGMSNHLILAAVKKSTMTISLCHKSFSHKTERVREPPPASCLQALVTHTQLYDAIL